MLGASLYPSWVGGVILSIDDYDERRQDSNDYLNRRQERLDFEDKLARRRDAVYDAIRKNDYSSAASEFDAAPSDSTGIDADYSSFLETRDRPQTAYGQFLKHSTRLIIRLESSRFLPANIAQQWVKRIKRLDIFQPSNGLLELDELYTDYLYAVDKYKPQRDIFDMAVAKTMEFDREMRELKIELDWLKAILKHVDAG